MKLTNKEFFSETNKSNNKFWIIIVAVVTLLLVLGFFYYQVDELKSSSSSDLGTYDNPEIAFKETQKALELVSKNINVGIISVQYLNEYEESKNLIFKSKSK